jgi:hypothetical protein
MLQVQGATNMKYFQRRKKLCNVIFVSQLLCTFALAFYVHFFCSEQGRRRKRVFRLCITASQTQGRKSVLMSGKNNKPTNVMVKVESWVGTGTLVMRRITTFRSTTDRIYDGGPIRL